MRRTPCEADPAGEAGLARFWEIAGQAAFRSGADVEAITYCDLAIPLADRLGLDGSLAMCLITKASAVTSMPGRFREGIALLAGAVKDARDRGQHSPAIRGLLNLGALTVLDNPRGSLAASREALDYAQRLGMSVYIPYIVGNLVVAVRTGDWDWLLATLADVDPVLTSPTARRWLRYAKDDVEVYRGADVGTRPEERIAIAAGTEDPQELVNGLSSAMERDLIKGDTAAALGWARRIRDEADDFHDAWSTVGRVALLGGDLELGRHALAWMTRRSAAGAPAADAQALRAGIEALEGRTGDAVAQYRAALAGYRELGLPFDVARVAMDMAAVLPPDDPAVVAAVAEARRILTSLGAVALLARLDELAPAAGFRHPRDRLTR